LILECTKSSEEKRSEGKLLHELMNILGFGQSTKLKYISGKDDFRLKIQEVYKDVDAPIYLHISAHGTYLEGKTWIEVSSAERKMRIYSNQISLWLSKRMKPFHLVFLSACEVGHSKMADALFKASCPYYIGPMHEVEWEDAAIFSALYYRLLLRGPVYSPWISFRNTYIALSKALPKLRGGWSFFERGKRRKVRFRKTLKL